MAASKITKSNLNIGAISETLKCSQSDMAQISSRNTFDLGRLCTHSNINKWAKYKPIHHSGLQILSDAERKDRTSDGEFYGILCRQTNMNLGSLHGATFAYNRPKGGASSPYRLSDFIGEALTVGYNHLARPNVMGRLSWSPTGGEGVFDLDGDDNVYCDFYVHDPDSTEIDLSEIYADRGVLTTIRNMYPVFMFGTSDMNIWVVAMRRADTNQPARIGDVVDANGIPRTGFTASFNSNFPQKTIINGTGDTTTSGSTTIQTTMPDNFPANTTKAEVPVTVSIGLVTSLVYTGLYDLNSWTEMSDKVTTNFALGVPADPSVMSYGLCGMAVTLKAKNADKYMTMLTSYGSLSLSVSLTRFLETLQDYNNFKLPDSGNVTINAYVSFDGGAGVAVAKSVPLKGENKVEYKYTASALFLWNEWGITGGLPEGTKVKSTITAYGIYNGVKIDIAKRTEEVTIKS